MADLSSHTETLLRLLEQYHRTDIWRGIAAVSSPNSEEFSDELPGQFSGPLTGQAPNQVMGQISGQVLGQVLGRVNEALHDQLMLDTVSKPAQLELYLQQIIQKKTHKKNQKENKSESQKEGRNLHRPNKLEPAVSYLAKARQFDGQVFSYFDADYPVMLKHIPDPPLVLFVKGASLASLSEASQLLAIVGARKASPYGKAAAQDLAGYLVGRGVVVVSGLALGIDAAAHRGSLAAHGQTIAVLGGGLDQIYPKSHTRMAEQLLDTGGCLVSEYPPGVKPRPYHFLERNRLISGLCHSVVVVEAAQRSGALNTARWALEQGRDVWALPGSVHSLVSKGCHRLIQEGANLIAEWQDLLPDDPGSTSAASQALAGLAAEIHAACCERAKTLDDLLLEIEADYAQLLRALSELEFAGFVQATPLGYIAASDNVVR